MEIRKLEIDFDTGVLKINDREINEYPILATLPKQDTNSILISSQVVCARG